MHRVLWAGVVLLLSAACLPHAKFLPEKSSSDLSLVREESPSLFTPSELDQLFSEEASLPGAHLFSLPSPSGREAPLAWSIEPPVCEESNDDFNLETLPGESAKNGQTFDIPIIVNARVEQFIQIFQTALKKNFSNWLARSERYIPSMKNVLRENGLPEDLVYLALIESGFNPYAYSRSKASGPWQFIYLTGKRYGLKANWWVDERRDPEKSTVAAARYLKDLYDLFECWYLAAAGYNAGERKIVNAMKRYGTEDFWELTKYRYLKQETKDYVPQMIAAALISKDPEKYGFVGIEYQEPLQYEKVGVPGGLDLRVIARACDIPVEKLKDLNPELLRWCTPPDNPNYEIKIPLGKKELFVKNLEALKPLPRSQFKVHVVKRGESLSRIARQYRVDMDPLLEINRLRKTSRLSAGMNLLIPIPVTPEGKTTVIAKKPLQKQDLLPEPEETVYTIKPGDTLWSIANETGVNIGTLGSWNNLHPEKKLVPGDKLKIKETGPAVASAEPEPPEGKGRREIIYVVREGDTLSGIAKKYRLSISEIRTWNQLDEPDRIRPSDRLKLKVESLKSSTLD